MNQSEITRFALPCLSIMTVCEGQLEEGFVVPGMVILGPGREFLVRRHEGRCNVMSEEMRIGIHMQKLNNIVMSDNATTACFRERLCRNDLPMIVGVVVTVPSQLLTYRNIF